MRKYRNMPEETKERISASMKGKAGHPQTENTRKKIADSMRAYWQTLSYAPDHTTMDELIGASTNNKGTVRQPQKKIPF